MNIRASLLARNYRRVFLVSLFLSVVIVFAWAGVAQAHANLVRSEPAANSVLNSAPKEVRLWFSESPEPRFSQIQLLDSSGKTVQSVGPVHSDLSNATALVVSVPPIVPGVYTVAWKAVSLVDGHATQGSFAFEVGGSQVPATGLRPVVPSGTAVASGNGPTLPDIVIQWIGYLGMAILAGSFAFLPLVLQPALRRANAGRPAAQSETTNVSILVTVLTAAWAVLVVITLAGAVLRATTSAGVEPFSVLGTPLADLLFGTRYGLVFWVRLLLLTLLGILIILYYRREEVRNAPVAWWTGFCLSSLVLLTTSVNSHAAAASDPILTTYVDWLHLNAVSLWVGGLVALLLTLPRLRRRAKDGSAAVAYAVSRFSQLATICVIIISITGFYRAVTEVGNLGNLFDTPYGTVLLIKLGLLCLVLGLAATNLLLIRRNLERAVIAPEPEVAIQPWYQRVRQTIGGEILSVSAIILVTSILVGLPPPREAPVSGLTIRGQAADLRVELVVVPGQAGFNSFDVYLQDEKGVPVADAEKVALIISMVGMDMGQSEAVALSTGDGHYLAQGDYISMVGTWRVEVLVRRKGQDDVRIDLTIRISRYEALS